MDFTWLAKEDELSSAALTVRAQTISPNDQDRLLWDAFFPRRNVDSTKLSEISTLDFRPVADRREWNQRGRAVPLKTPPRRDLEMVPVESYFTIDEEELQKLAERSLSTNAEIFRRIIGARIPDRTDELVRADYRRLEIDCMTAWALGQIVAKNPQDGTTQTVSFGFDAGRYQTAGTAWSDGGVNAYDEFLAWAEDGVDSIGPIRGVTMRLATFKAIQADAPNQIPGTTGITPTRAQVEQRVSDDLGVPFRFFIVENSLDVFNDGGTAYTRTKVWPAQRVALVPAGNAVGYAAFAPVYRAMELARQVPGAGIDIRGVTVYHDAANAGRELTVEAQLNAMPVPDEQKMWLINAGV